MTESPHPLAEVLRTALAEAKDPEKAAKMQAYMKSEMPFYGVGAPQQRDILRQAWKEHPVNDIEEYESVIRDLWDNAHFREERYSAQEIAKKYRKFHVMEMLPLYRHMIVTGAWWDHVDMIAADLVGSLLAKFPKEMKPEMERWIEDEDLWIRRAAILSQLRFKRDTDEKMLFDFCERCMEEKTFWMRKAIGWALRQYSKTSPFEVRRFVDRHEDKMAGLTFREATKYI